MYCSSHPSIQRGRRALRSGCSCNDRNCRPSACTGSRNPFRNSAPRKSPCTRTPSSRERFCTRPRSNSARRPTTFASSAWWSVLSLEIKGITFILKLCCECTDFLLSVLTVSILVYFILLLTSILLLRSFFSEDVSSLKADKNIVRYYYIIILYYSYLRWDFISFYLFCYFRPFLFFSMKYGKLNKIWKFCLQRKLCFLVQIFSSDEVIILFTIFVPEKVN